MVVIVKCNFCGNRKKLYRKNDALFFNCCGNRQIISGSLVYDARIGSKIPLKESEKTLKSVLQENGSKTTLNDDLKLKEEQQDGEGNGRNNGRGIYPTEERQRRIKIIKTKTKGNGNAPVNNTSTTGNKETGVPEI